MIDEVSVSLSQLKSCAAGDQVVILTEAGEVGWFTVASIVGQRGAKGGTTVTLEDIVTGDSFTQKLTTSLPEGVARIRRVMAGLNSRTLQKVAPLPKKVVVQPEGEFQNILDVPEEPVAVLAQPEAATVTESMPSEPVEPVLPTEAVVELVPVAVSIPTEPVVLVDDEVVITEETGS